MNVFKKANKYQDQVAVFECLEKEIEGSKC